MANATGTDADLSAAGTLLRRKAYSDAVRHSGRVRRLKIMLPVMAFVIAALFIAVSAIGTYFQGNFEIAGAKIENGQIVMEKPAVSGRNASGIFYSMTADRALQSITNPNVITLETIRALVPMNDDMTARVTAGFGIYDRSTDRLNMTKPFSIDLSSGMTASFRSAYMDVKGGSLKTDETVSITSPQASIVAQRMIIEDKGNDISFEGGVQVNINPEALRRKGN